MSIPSEINGAVGGLNKAISGVNGVTSIFTNPCNATAYIYAKTAFPAAGELALGLLSFGLGDLARGALRPKNARGGRHMRRGGGKGGKGGIPELGNRLGSALAGGPLTKRTAGAALRGLWLLDNVVQGGLLAFLLMDLGEDFSFNWSSGIISEACDPNITMGLAVSKSVEPTLFFSLANAWTTVPSGIVVSVIGDASSRFAVHSNAGKPFQYSTHIEATRTSLSGGPIQLRELSGGEERGFESGDGDDPSAGGKVGGDGSSASPFVSYQYRSNGGVYTGVARSVTSAVSPGQ